MTEFWKLRLILCVINFSLETCNGHLRACRTGVIFRMPHRSVIVRVHMCFWCTMHSTWQKFIKVPSANGAGGGVSTVIEKKKIYIYIYTQVALLTNPLLPPISFWQLSAVAVWRSSNSSTLWRFRFHVRRLSQTRVTVPIRGRSISLVKRRSTVPSGTWKITNKWCFRLVSSISDSPRKENLVHKTWL